MYASRPWRTHSASVLGPVPPRLPSTLIRSKAPGAPVLPSGSVVVFDAPKHGQPEVPLSFGCSRLTPIGATYLACCIRLARAVAVEPTLTELTPKSLVKTPAAGRLTWTLIVSFVPRLFMIWMSDPESPPPFLPAYWR